MLKLFVQSILSALPLCLAISILLASRAYSPKERRVVARLTAVAVLLGLTGAAVIAWLRLNTRLVDIPTFNTWMVPLTLVASLAFLAAVWMFGSRDLHDIEQTWRHRLLTATSLVALIANGVFHGFTYFFNMSSIVPMGSSILDTESLLRLAGYAVGSILVVVLAWGYVVSAARVPWYVRSTITSVVFLAMIGPRAILLYQQFATRGLVPRNSLVFDLVLWIQRNGAATQIALTVLIALPGLLALWTQARVKAANPAQERLHRAERLSRRRFLGLSVVGSLLMLVTLTEGKKRAEYVPELSAIEPSQVEGEWVTVSRELVSDGHLHRFAYRAQDNTEVRFIAIKKNEVAFGTGLDACEICGDSGYYEDKGKVICRECDVMMNIQTIGFPGGCNPIPIAYELTADKLMFSVAELDGHSKIFKS